MHEEVFTPRLRLRRPVAGQDDERYRRLLLDPALERWLWPPPLEPPGVGGADAALARDAELGLGELVAFTLVENVASRRVMERAGFALDRPIEHAGLPHVRYRRAP